MIRKLFILSILLNISLFSYAQTTWYEIESNTTQNLEAIDFVDTNPTIGFIGGDNILLKTVDSGETWNPVTVESTPDENSILDVHDIHFVDENHGFITSNESVWETFDGGYNWTGTADWSMCYAYSLYFLNENTRFVGGSGCFEGHIIYRIENGEGIQAEDPEDWSGGEQNHVVTINFKDDLLGLAGTANGMILRTTDGGFNWDTIPNVANGFSITGFVFEENLIRGTHRNQDQFGTMVSLDDGLTWNGDGETATFFYPKMNASHINGLGKTFLGGIEGNSFETGVIFNNSQGFWSYDAVEYQINDIDSHSDSTVFCVGTDGSIYCNVDPDVINSIDEVVGSLNLEIYPNPAESYLMIKGDVGSRSSYEITDISGRKIIDGLFNYGTLFTIDIENLSKGAYSITIVSDRKIESFSFQKN